MPTEVDRHVIDELPAFVLGILTDEETNAVVEHLATCTTCQAELARLQQVAEDLPLALAQTTPPVRVKESLMRAVRSQQSMSASVSQPAQVKKPSNLFRSLLPLFGAALIVVLATVNLLLWRQLNQPAGTPMQVVALANTPSSPEGLGTLILDESGWYGSLVVDKLADLGADNQYQVWLIKDGERTSGGVFSVNHDGYASLELEAPQPLDHYDSLGITIEPYGGSPGPTGAKVLGGDIPH